MQEMTNFLCHTFLRCIRSISVVAPVQYAHLAAFRMKEHMFTFKIKWTDDKGHELSPQHRLRRTLQSEEDAVSAEV
ncbi:hypothetical protein LAZ67_1003295 [Cordylochernes scorpioides]|uniref:Piwi domain-containing protein n=1 Tax=Cordylochernes scorpioides TaxID=51811 RepID=A0ABY6JWW8_9ARAC|nr:hypothetical protein LAZ67_1003295 [Cordylochernes scorpioides]